MFAVKAIARLLLFAGLAGAVGAALYSARPTWAAHLGLDFWEVPSLTARIASDRQEAVNLATKDEQVLRRIAAKEAIVEDLIHARMDLLDAAARFRALTAGQRGYALVLRSMYPNMTDEERVCRNVISYVESYVESDEDGRALVHRLCEQLGGLKSSARLHLPGPPVDLDAAVAADDDEFDDAQ